MIVLDNLTFQGALRVLAPAAALPRTYGDEEKLYSRHGEPHPKWNYELNEDLRRGVDIACLASITQALVLHDRIAVSPSLLDNWCTVDSASGTLQMPSVFSGLTDVITLVGRGTGRDWRDLS
jgi:hypothetical protein